MNAADLARYGAAAFIVSIASSTARQACTSTSACSHSFTYFQNLVNDGGNVIYINDTAFVMVGLISVDALV